MRDTFYRLWSGGNNKRELSERENREPAARASTERLGLYRLKLQAFLRPPWRQYEQMQASKKWLKTEDSSRKFRKMQVLLDLWDT